ncbi:conserved Plasmodium protein, unknown function [Plasmodium sp. DRC-Itaito]|nr:conserved Plasmodium protein, unknown function [Plasmodium sp. DRC-Itaito]
MEYLLNSTLKKCDHKLSFFLGSKYKFSSLFENSKKNVNSFSFETKEINDYNYRNLLTNEKVFLVYGYANYSYKCINIFNKLIDIIKKDLENKSDKNVSIYKLNVSNNNLLVKQFHIKNIPLIQLRYNNKLMQEINGNDLNENNIKNILKRYYNYFNTLDSVNDINDFLVREDDLLYNNNESSFYSTKSNNNLKDESDNVYNELTLINHEKEKIITNEIKNHFKNDILDKLQLNYNCSSYIVFKKLELLLIEKSKNTKLIKQLLNDIIFHHSTYLDINEHYSKIAAKAFLYLFDEHLISIEKLIELKDIILKNENQTEIKVDDIKLINFLEPIINFDNSKIIHYNKFQCIDDFLSTCEETNDHITLLLSSSIKKNILNTQLIDINQINDDIKIKYLSRIYRILSIKYFHIGDIQNCLSYALHSYKLNAPLKNIDSNKSKVLIENLILYYGAYNNDIINFLSELQFLFTDKNFKVIKFPHTRAFKGGRPMMKRGKSGKWLWLSPDWKPRWLKKKSKLILEDEWKCVPDKNVPFWN